MNVASPDILTLLAWAERRAAGQPCAEWDAWRAASREAAWKAECIRQAHILLANRRVGFQPAMQSAEGAPSELSPEEVSQLIDGGLAAQNQTSVEAACWKSTTQLAEVLSAVRFRQEQPVAAPSAQLSMRLAALVPALKPQHANGKPERYRLSPVVDQSSEETVKDPPRVVTVQLAAPPPAEADTQSANRSWSWPLAIATLVGALFFGGALGWLAATWRRSTVVPPPIARDTKDVPFTPERAVDLPPPQPREADKTGPEPSINRSTPRPIPSSTSDLQEPNAKTTGKENLPRTGDDQKKSPSRPATAPALPKHRPPIAPQAPDLAFRSAQGILLVDAGQHGTWRATPGTLSLREPINVMSLAESWTTAEVPGVGNLVWEGNGEATLTMLPDGTIEIRVVQGRMAVEGLKPGAQIRLLAGDAAWTARGEADSATLAVVYDKASPGLLVPSGLVMVDDLLLASGQMTRWYDGAPQPPQPLTPTGSTPADAAAGIAPPLMNPWDLSWLTPPDENSRKAWRTLYGRMADRLAAADDAGSELAKMAADIREPRQAALLARWNIAAAPVAARSSQIWKSLTDRRAIVRVAAVKSLLELSPGDERRKEADKLLSEKLGGATANKVNEWLATVWQAGAPPKPQADEMVAALQHNELAVRQIAVSMLELHTAAAFMQVGGAPPVYDAGSTAARRGAAQLEWARILQELYNPTRKAPAMRTRQAQALQNAAPGGT